MSRNPLALGNPLYVTAGEPDIRVSASPFACSLRFRLRGKTNFYVSGNCLLGKLTLSSCNFSTACRGGGARSTFGPSLGRGRRDQGSCVEEERRLKDRRLKDAADRDGHLVRKKRYVKGADIDRAAFSRVYDVAALRVPSEESEELAYKLKGHLLNWPRIKNIARVAGDQLDEDIEKLMWDGQRQEQAVSESVRKAVFSDESLPPAIEANARVTKKELRIRFPHLEALSRPTGAARFFKQDRLEEVEEHSYKSNMVEAKGVTRSMWEEKAVVVEIVESTACTANNSGPLDDFLGLLKQGKLPRRYRGSTRLLLLDEGLADKPLSELPMALQVTVSAGIKRGFATRDLVQTRLILSYDYWPVDEILNELLPKDVIVQPTFDKLGHIARLHLQEEYYSFRHVVAQVILDRHKPRIRSVVCNVPSTIRSYGRPELELLAGNARLVTSLIQNGTLFKIDLAKGSWPKIAAAGQSTRK